MNIINFVLFDLETLEKSKLNNEGVFMVDLSSCIFQ